MIEGLDWDDAKSHLLKKTRGLALEDVASYILFSHHVLYRNKRYPDQLRAIGAVNNTLYTLVFEDIKDEFGTITHLITYWEATPEEKKIYRQHVGRKI